MENKETIESLKEQIDKLDDLIKRIVDSYVLMEDGYNIGIELDKECIDYLISKNITIDRLQYFSQVTSDDLKLKDDFNSSKWQAQ